MTSEYQTRIILKNVRGSYVNLTDEQLEGRKAKAEKEGKSSKIYQSIQLIIPKDHPQLEEVGNAIEEAIRQGRDNGKLPKNENAKLKLPLRDGEEPKDDGEPRDDAFNNAYFINANNRSSYKVGILNRHKETPTEQDLNDYCYSGAYFHVSLNFYPFANPELRGVAVSPNNVMLYKKGDSLIKKDDDDESESLFSTASSDFSAIAVEEDDLDDLDDF